MQEPKHRNTENVEKAEEKGSASARPSADPGRAARYMVLKPKAMFGALLVYAGAAAYIFLGDMLSIQELLQKYARELIAVPLLLVGAYIFAVELFKGRTRIEPRFVDVDVSRERPGPVSLLDLAGKVERLQLELDAAKSSSQMDSLHPEPTPVQAPPPPPELTFIVYFESIRNLLEQKADVADRKASILLDKGTGYSRFGIGFFIFAIVVWQGVASYTGFKIQYIYGIVSTSLLFIFIEFLSAWFLRQYRQFVDTSTYLIKVKSIFDKYMLVYLAGREAIAEGHDTKKSKQVLFSLLGEEITWPDTYLTKNPDVSFAKEALEAMTLMVKSMKADAKGKAGAEAKVDVPE